MSEIFRITKIMFVRLLVFTILLVTCHAAYATNYYFGINYGAASQDSKISVIDNSIDPDIPYIANPKEYVAPDETVTAKSIFIGYRVGRDVALEFGYVQLDDAFSTPHGIASDDPTKNLVAGEGSRFSFNYLALTGVWPMGTNWSLNARLGVASWEYEFLQVVLDFDNTSVPPSNAIDSIDYYSDKGSDFFYGLGLGYGINQNFEIRADFMYMAFDPEFINVNVEQKMSLFFIGAAYHF